MAVKLNKVASLNEGVEVPGAVEPYYPSFELGELDLPGMKDFKISQEIKLVIKTRIKRMVEGRHGEFRTTFEVMEVGVDKK